MFQRITVFSVLLVLVSSVTHAQEIFQAKKLSQSSHFGINERLLEKINLSERQSNSSSTELWSLCAGLIGGGLGFGIHEEGHIVANSALQSNPYVKVVRGARLPFLAISHRRELPDWQESIVSSAGLWSQFIAGEQILTRTLNIRFRQAHFRKGLLAFHVGTSILYGVTGLAGIGPPERDARTIGNGSRSDEMVVGSVVLAVGLMDSYRYYRHSPRWARWVSRSAKLAMLLPSLLRH